MKIFQNVVLFCAVLVGTATCLLGQDVNPRGIYFNRFTGPFNGTEWFQLSTTNGTTYLLRDIYGGGWTGTIDADGNIAIPGFPAGSFSSPDNFVIFPSFAGGPFVFTCNRVPTTTVDFPLRLFSPRPAPTILAGQWNNTLQFFNPETGQPNAPATEIINVTTNGNTVRITDPGGLFFQGVFEDGLNAGFRSINNPSFGGNPGGVFASFPGSANNLGQDVLGEMNLISVNEFRASFLLQSRTPLGNQTQQVVEFRAERVNPIAMGDVNGDGTINDVDEFIVSNLQGNTFEDNNYNIAADVNLDGQIDFRDLAFYCTQGDVNGDGSVDLLDVGPFVVFVANNVFTCEADVNIDGQVDLLDVAPFVALLSGGG